jgi:hypothetical protein
MLQVFLRPGRASGDEFGFFMFGGSDVVMLFQSKQVVIDAKVGTRVFAGATHGRGPLASRATSRDGHFATRSSASSKRADK